MAVLSGYRSIFLALIMAIISTQVIAANPALMFRQATCAALPGVGVNTRSLSVSERSLFVRQTASDTVSLAALLAQDTPCIPPSISVATIRESAQSAQDVGRVTAQGFGSFFKGVWNAVQGAIKVIADVQAVLIWGDVVSLIQLGIDAWRLVGDVRQFLIVATSPDGSLTRTFQPTKIYKPPKEKPCGWGTGKICPRELVWAE
ncbi:hypothetical protein P154DRAFT_567386 [Amniculicola lignicola CBS 123094]|uniref:Uncharacterized protein n=1 Tax=Amniculicola lignicola CBS 123094 TaxID=1392246 RepID=A0A6A5W9T7_9PLEO|nr:hypothetical protein P154DRAFT_567386 [Amniculicola lignicola CBS 123094]